MKKLNDGITVFGKRFDGVTVFETPINPPPPKGAEIRVPFLHGYGLLKLILAAI